MDPITMAILTAVVSGITTGGTKSLLDALISKTKQLGDSGDKIIDAANQL